MNGMESYLHPAGRLPGLRRIRIVVSLWIVLLFGTGSAARGASADRYLELRDATKATSGWGGAKSHTSVDGRPLRIGTEVFPQGIGTHAPAELVFPLDGLQRWVTFYAGVSADMTEKGTVTVQVWTDGRKAFETDVMRVREAPRYVSLPVSGVRELKLVVTDAGDGIAADHLNLGHLRVSTGEQAPRPEIPLPPDFIGEASAPASPLTLWYRRPAKRWLEALPIGNGRLGAMIFGGVPVEKLALNESTFWSGAPDPTQNNPEGREHLPEMRRLLFAGEYRKAVDLISRHLLGRQGNYGSHLPVGDLLLEMRHPDGEVRDYRRDLDLDRAAATVNYSMGGVRFTREVIASHADNVIAVRLSADRPGSVSFKMGFQANREPNSVTTRGDDTLVITADARETKHSDGRCGVSLVGMVRAIPEGGQVKAGADFLEVDGANSVTLLMALNTTFGGRSPAELGAQQLTAAAARSFTALRERHRADYEPLFHRVSLDLGPAPTPASPLPTDERLARLRQGGDDAALVAQFFQYGRYLLIAGSREDSPLPTNLQGIWNDNLACNMGWTCDFHLDINTQQNYWPAEVANLSECHEPLFRLIESLRAPGRRTAQLVYGARGWVCHTITNPWGFTAPGWWTGWGPNPTAGVWIASHVWEHYRFTGDREFLRARGYPILKEAAEFFLDFMVEHPTHGWLVTGPATSPENAFIAPNGQGVVSESMGPTCDTVLVRDLFASCIDASRTLGVDADFRATLEAALKKLPPLRIGKHGQLMEWLEDYEEAIPNHRHTTHLIALFPSEQITPRATPDLAEAARVTLHRRIDRKDWEDVEWSRGNLIAFFARLADGDSAYHHVLGLLREDTDADLLTFSRSGIAGASENIFCVDGNSAGTAGIAEMLLQSHGDEIELLPALPRAWPKGSVRGLKARGNVTVDIDWDDGRVIRHRLTSPQPREVKVRIHGSTTAQRTTRPNP